MTKPILPGATIGVLGSGQLGRMLALVARRMGYRVHTYSPDVDSPTGQVADREHSGSYDDLNAVRAFANAVDVVTYEFENVPAATADACAALVPVRPNYDVLRTTQNRLREKAFLARVGIPLTAFRRVRSQVELRHALADLGYPAVLKTSGFGYDGKGQAKIAGPDDVPQAARLVGLAIGPDDVSGTDAIVEAFVDFDREVSVVAARGLDGDFVHFGVIENSHANHILDVSIAPADVPAGIARKAVDMARAILEHLDVVGVLCVEMFLTRDGRLLVNELAPRPHNSGHLTIEACVTSQFEQQLRAVCGLPLGSTEQLRPAAMANLLGDLWTNGEPDWAAASAFPDVKLHLYGKQAARPGRKMGHLTALAATPAEAGRLARAARDALTRRSANI